MIAYTIGAESSYDQAIAEAPFSKPTKKLGKREATPEAEEYWGGIVFQTGQEAHSYILAPPEPPFHVAVYRIRMVGEWEEATYLGEDGVYHLIQDADLIDKWGSIWTQEQVKEWITALAEKYKIEVIWVPHHSELALASASNIWLGEFADPEILLLCFFHELGHIRSRNPRGWHLNTISKEAVAWETGLSIAWEEGYRWNAHSKAAQAARAYLQAYIPGYSKQEAVKP